MTAYATFKELITGYIYEFNDPWPRYSFAVGYVPNGTFIIQPVDTSKTVLEIGDKFTVTASNPDSGIPTSTWTFHGQAPDPQNNKEPGIWGFNDDGSITKYQYFSNGSWISGETMPDWVNNVTPTNSYTLPLSGDPPTTVTTEIWWQQPEFDLDTPPILDPTAFRDGEEQTNVNGIFDQSLLDGDGTREFGFSILDAGFAAFDNSLGIYEIDGNGNIVDVQLLFADVKDTYTPLLTREVEDGNSLGFFILQDAADFVRGVDPEAELSFINSAGSAANVADGSDLHFAIDGANAGLTAYHSYDSALNADGIQHARSGVNDLGYIIGFEDLTGGGDRDFEDVVVMVEIL